MNKLILALLFISLPTLAQAQASYSLTPLPNRYQSAIPITPNPTGTTSLTKVMIGAGATITPKAGGIVTVTVSGNLVNNTLGDGSTADLRYGTGTAPANGDAVTGTRCAGDAYVGTTAAAVEHSPFSLTCIIAGLTIGTPIWIDLSFAAVTGGTASITQLNIAAITR
jgi:hypothetical protein